MSGLIRIWKQSKAVRGTHVLERADVRTDQVMETKQSRRGTHVLERVDIRTG